MTRYVLTIILSVTVVFSGWAQSGDSLSLDVFKNNFSVPDIPAFEALDVSEDQSLDPSDIKKFAIAFSPFNLADDLTIPRSFAMEVSPGRFLSHNWALEDYRNMDNGRRKFNAKQWAYNSSVSMATQWKDDNTSAVSLGYRFSIPLANDPIFDEELEALIREGNKAVLLTKEEFRSEWLEKKGLEVIDLVMDEALQEEFEGDWQEFETEQNASFVDAYINNPDFNYNTAIEDYKAKNWNAPRVDLAFVWVGNSPDSIVSNIHVNRWSAWFSASGRLGKNTGMMGLVGMNYQWFAAHDPTIDKKDELTFYMRVYKGNSRFKGYVEYQFQNKTLHLVTGPGQVDTESGSEKVAYLNMGGDIYLSANFWLNVTAGVSDFYDKDKEKRKFVSNIQLKYGFN